MADILATLFRFRQFIFEYMPLFLVAWVGLAVTTGLITVVSRNRFELREPVNPSFKKRPFSWLWQFLLSMLWHPGGKTPPASAVGVLFIFSLAASIPALVATSLIDMNVVLLRIALAALLTPSLHWLATSKLLPNPGAQPETARGVQSPAGDKNVLETGSRPASMVGVGWKSFTGQVNSALLPLLIGFALASAISVYVPVYVIQPWLGKGSWWSPYLAALLTIPFQLSGGAEVPLASALLVKGASLGTALSVMLAAPITVSAVIRHFCQPMKVKAVAVYLVAAWLIAGSLGVVVNVVQRLFG